MKEKKTKKEMLTIKEPDMEIGTNTLKLIVEAAKTPDAYKFEKASEFRVNVNFPRNVKIPANMLKKMKNDIENILGKKPPTQVLYPWVIKEYSSDDLKAALKYLKEGRVKLSKK